MDGHNSWSGPDVYYLSYKDNQIDTHATRREAEKKSRRVLPFLFKPLRAAKRFRIVEGYFSDLHCMKSFVQLPETNEEIGGDCEGEYLGPFTRKRVLSRVARWNRREWQRGDSMLWRLAIEIGEPTPSWLVCATLAPSGIGVEQMVSADAPIRVLRPRAEELEQYAIHVDP